MPDFPCPESLALAGVQSPTVTSRRSCRILGMRAGVLEVEPGPSGEIEAYSAVTVFKSGGPEQRIL